MFEDAVKRTCSFDVCYECPRSCCQDAKPPLTEERMKLIENYLKSHDRLDGQVFTISAYSFPSVNSIGFCVFYGKGTKNAVFTRLNLKLAELAQSPLTSTFALKR
jgi:Fe-S-cluster containining protein